jgi:hypothetical protein
MFTLRRHRLRRRQTSELTRLLLALDAISGPRPAARRRRGGFVSLGRY